MNREIKFRGKTKSGPWVYGTPVFYQNGEVCIYNDKCDHYGCEATSIAEMRNNIIPETLGEYTGLKDKNGKDIYEGDIVMQFGMKHTVVFKNGAFGYNTIEQPNNTYDYFIPFGANGHFEWDNNQQSYKIIVIGNIYENQELLK